MRGMSNLWKAVLTAGMGASLAVLSAVPAGAATINNPLTVTGGVRCVVGSAESLLITGGGESHGATVRPGGTFAVTFGNPTLPGTATATVRCDIAGRRTYASTTFPFYRPGGGQPLVVNLTVR
ncbi:conserved exported hypothetical protein [Frankia canadensis]|uniref:Uncharacterized protein n=1 Tax=Frankia canadensis TaxID=1836972 RepID=A0A2I2KUH7_9ACTN|nr:conserved exported hypothetical protein [Frankia canadensis]SOU56598.1 conserved exported hypothetical protein [Frankia canadensis]